MVVVIFASSSQQTARMRRVMPKSMSMLRQTMGTMAPNPNPNPNPNLFLLIREKVKVGGSPNKSAF
jgi:hypothetical protein